MFEVFNIGVVKALAAGAISFLSPCMLPLVPGYVSYVAGNAAVASAPARTVSDSLITSWRKPVLRSRSRWVR